MHRHLRSTGLSELASDTLSETLPTTFGIYEKHKCIGQVDLKFDKQGNLIPFANNGEGSSHYHKFSENPSTGMVSRKSGQKNNHHPIDDKYDSLIQKIIEYNKAKHR